MKCFFASFRLPALLLMSQFAFQPVLASEDGDSKNTEDGPWISATQWLDDEHIVGTQSEGLLLRPAKVVKAKASDPAELETIGEAETSLWSVLAVDGKRVVASDYKGAIFLYGDGEPKKFETDSRWSRALATAPDEGQILVGTEDGKLIVLSVADAKELRRIDAHSAAIFDIAISPAGDKIATAAGDGSIKVFSWPELEPQAEMSRDNQAVWAVVFSADGSRLISGGSDRRIQLWDVEKSASIVTISRTGDWITSLVALPESHLVAAGCMDGEVVVVDYQTMQPVTSAAAESPIWSLSLSPAGDRVAAGTRKRGLAIMPTADWIAAGEAASRQAATIRPPSPRNRTPEK